MSTTSKDKSLDSRKTTTHKTNYMSRIIWFVCGITLGVVCVIILGIYILNDDDVQVHIAEDNIERARLVDFVAALENIVVSLAVDTERSAIGIAELNVRLVGIERRLSSLEKAPN